MLNAARPKTSMGPSAPYQGALSCCGAHLRAPHSYTDRNSSRVRAPLAVPFNCLNIKRTSLVPEKIFYFTFLNISSTQLFSFELYLIPIFLNWVIIFDCNMIQKNILLWGVKYLIKPWNCRNLTAPGVCFDTNNRKACWQARLRCKSRRRYFSRSILVNVSYTTANIYKSNDLTVE